MVNKDWAERRKMTDFLYNWGWQLTQKELWNVIQEYGLEKDWNEEKEKERVRGNE